MRPNHNKRMRGGRPQGNRRGPNPLTRSYESNGPDVKIRGNAHHIAEKYLQLARDAHTGGDPIAAENYLQHAEHYFRMIAAAQAAQALAQSGRPPGEGEVEDGEDDDDLGGMADRFASPLERQPQPMQQQPAFAPNGGPPQGQGQGGQPQGPVEGRPQGERDGYQQRDNYNRNDRNDRNGYRGDRGPRQDRQGNQEFRGNRDQRPREFRVFRDYQPRPDAPPQGEGEAPGLPSFITGTPRPPNANEAGDFQPETPMESAAPIESGEAPAQDEGFAPGGGQQRGRRRRLRSPYGMIRQGEDGGEGGGEE
jgi:hypothetical protein